MAGIIFLRTRDLPGIVRFYRERVGMKLWLDQGDCVILRHDNLLLGFCARPGPDLGGTITFFFPTRAEVDQAHERFRDTARAAPQENPKYRIYNFFARDPEGRSIEFQTFLHTVDVEPGFRSLD